MAALSVADTTEYGIVRIICSDTEARSPPSSPAATARSRPRSWPSPFRTTLGGAADLLEKLDDLDVDIEYFYCFSTTDDMAVLALKIADPASAAEASWAIEKAGFHVFDQDEVE